MSLINISNLTFAYEGSYDNIFEDVSFQIDTDWKLGFIGRNGRGKTTFLKLLLGQYEYQGKIACSVEFDYFPFTVADKEQNTLDVVYGIDNQLELWKLRRELSLLDAGDELLYRPFSTLSNGEQTKVLLAGLFLKENNFLLIDEPTNHLDTASRRLVGEYLKRKKGFILVSHDRSFLDLCIDHVLSINKADIQIQKGNCSSWWENRQRQDEFELNENEKLKKEIGKLTASARRTSGWSDDVEKTKLGTRTAGLRPDRGFIGHKAAKMMKRSKAMETRKQNAIDEKSKLLKNIETSHELMIKPEFYHKDRMAELKDIALYYDSNEVCNGVNLTIHNGDRILVQGKNGSGKSSILKLLCGFDISYTGHLGIGSNLKISYVPQDTSGLTGGLREFEEKNDLDESLFRAVLRKLDLERVQFEKDFSDYSEGQKKKVLIAKSLCEKAHLYIWDESLNYIDILSRMQIEELILEYKPTMLFVEHDGAFAEKIATKILVL